MKKNSDRANSYKRLAAAILGKDDIVIIAHANPDGDALGSAFALCYALRSKNKRVAVLCSDDPPEKYPPLLGESSAKSADFDAAFIISVDTATEDLFGDSLKDYYGRVDISIDHHPSNTGYAEYTHLEPDAAATGEIIYNLIKAMDTDITKDIAVSLYTAISTDTGGFRFANTTSRTLKIASELYKYDIDFAEVNRILFLQKSMRQATIECIAFDSVHFYNNGTIASVSISLKDIARAGATLNDLESLSNIPRYIEGVDTGFAMRETSPDEWKISARSNKLDVSRICAVFGGGGHISAAGCTISGEENQVRKRFAKAVMEEYSVIQHKSS